MERFASAVQDEFDNVYRFGGPGENSLTWDTLTGKPATFPPSSHHHEIADINGLSATLASFGLSSIAISPTWIAYGSGLNTIGGDANLTWSGTVLSLTGTLVTTAVPTLPTQTANRIFSGPSSGGAAIPAFRALVSADIPSLAYAPTGAITGSGLTMATARILGRTTASTGAIEELTAGTSLSLSGGSLNTIQGIRTSDSPAFAGLTVAGDGFFSQTSSQVIIGAASSLTGALATDAPFQIRRNASASTDIEVFRFSASSTTAPTIILSRSGSATLDTNAIVSSGQRLGAIDFAGADGTNYLISGQIKVEVDGTPGSTDMPGRIMFLTKMDGAAGALTEALRLSNDQTAIFASTIKTADPGTGAGAWLLGQKKTAGVSVTAGLDYLDVKVDGTLYHIPLAVVV